MKAKQPRNANCGQVTCRLSVVLHAIQTLAWHANLTSEEVLLIILKWNLPTGSCKGD